MLNDCYFFNNYHLGDVIMSRVLVREAIKQIGAKNNFYCHNFYSWHTDAIAKKSSLVVPDYKAFQIENNKLYFQTWFGNHPNKEKNIETDSNSINICHLEYQVERFSTFLNKLGFNGVEYILDDTQKYCLDYGESPINKKNILVFNTIARSGQGDNVDNSSHILELADSFKDHTFFISNPINGKRDNIIFKYEIPDLIEISKSCRIITGVINGPLMSTWFKWNIFNKDKTYISLHKINRGETQFCNNQTCQNIWVKDTNSLYKELRKNLE